MAPNFYTFMGTSIDEEGPYKRLSGFTRDLSTGATPEAQYTSVYDYLTAVQLTESA